MEKDPRHRLQTARDVGNEFRDLARQTSPHVTSATPPASRAVAAPDSGASSADERFRVAVQPFKHSGNADLTALADGLSEGIVAGLSRFSYFRVIARAPRWRHAAQDRGHRSPRTVLEPAPGSDQAARRGAAQHTSSGPTLVRDLRSRLQSGRGVRPARRARSRIVCAVGDPMACRTPRAKL
jgi:hypothetical protein